MEAVAHWSNALSLAHLQNHKANETEKEGTV